MGVSPMERKTPMNKRPNMDNADNWFKQAIRWRDGYQCQFCMTVARDVAFCDCAHIVGRREKIVRWDADNALTLCRDHHRYFTDHPAEFETWIRTTKGDDFWYTLQSRRRMALKCNTIRLKEIAAHYRSERRRMEQEGTRDLKPWEPYELFALRAQA